MVAVVTNENRSAYQQELKSMHRHRKQVFVDFLKWDIPVVDGQYEIDQFDADDAVYLMVVDAKTHSHMGSVRLLPSTSPHMLGDVFPFLCDGGVPVAQDIWEITRLCTAPGVANPKIILNHLATALMEFGLLYGVRQYTCVSHMTGLSQMLAFGWECEPLGLPQTVNQEQIGAMAINVSPTALQMFRQRLGVRLPLLQMPMPAHAA